MFGDVEGICCMSVYVVNLVGGNALAIVLADSLKVCNIINDLSIMSGSTTGATVSVAGGTSTVNTTTAIATECCGETGSRCVSGVMFGNTCT